MSVQILVSTFMDSIHRVPRVLASLPNETAVLVVHQIPDGKRYDYDSIFSDRCLEVIPVQERGLAKSRNRAAAMATGDILVPTDDDVIFLPDALTQISAAFSRQYDAQILTFQVVDEELKTYKTYPANRFRHNLNSIRRVYSIEIALRREAIVDRGLAWDEAFGLNSHYPGGLEQAFLKNVLDLGLPAYYEPVPIVLHPPNSTGYNHTPESGFFRGAVYAKLFGYGALPLLAGFAAKNSWRTGSVYGAMVYTRQLYLGALDYLKISKRKTAQKDVRSSDC